MLLQMALFHSSLWLSSIPLYMCTVSPLSVPLPVASGHLGCFHFLAVGYNATLNIGEGARVFLDYGSL